MFVCFYIKGLSQDDYYTNNNLPKTDSISYSKEYVFNEGIYLTIDQFKQNNPIPKSVIVSDIPKTESDFFNQLLDQNYIIYKDSLGKEQKVETENIWGCCINQNVFINYNVGRSIIGSYKSFNRIGVIGTLCHFNVEFYNPGGPISTDSDEFHQYVLDTQTNKIWQFNGGSMENILRKDTGLHNEFAALGYLKKNRLSFIYLRKYNEKHPLYLPSK